jgi:hypothetical protein
MKSLKLLAAALFVGSAAHLMATTITFDDLPSGGFYPIPEGYEGLNWTNFWRNDSRNYDDVGYSTGVVSPVNVAFNAFGDPASISINGGVFDLTSAYLTGGFSDLNVRVIGAANGVTLFDNTYAILIEAPTLINFNYLGVDAVQFVSFGNPYNLNHFVMDNLTINTSSVPDNGSTAMLLVIGVVGILFRAGCDFPVR